MKGRKETSQEEKESIFVCIRALYACCQVGSENFHDCYEKSLKTETFCV